MYETSVGIVLFKVKNKVEFLIMQRTEDKIWDFPKGHQYGLESEKTTALRELKEETQITEIELIDDYRNEYKFINAKGSHRRIILFLGKTEKEPVLSDEHQDFKWVEFEEACKLLKYKEKIKLLTEVKEYLITKNYTF